MKLMAPNGTQIRGTVDLIPGVALTNRVTRNDKGEIEIDYAGETKVDWDGQRNTTETDDQGKEHIVFEDEDGNGWRADQLIEDPEDEEAE